MEVKKVSSYTYLILFASLVLWGCAILASLGEFTWVSFWGLFGAASVCFWIVVVGLTMIRKAVGLDVSKKIEPEVSKHGLWHYLSERKNEVDKKV